jgi:hypothetical protein
MVGISSHTEDTMSFLDKIRELFGGCHKHDDYAVVMVQKGDSLSQIAEDITGDASNWTKIAAMNPDLTDPNMIHPGQELKIPLDWVE